MARKLADPKKCTKCKEHKPRSEFTSHAVSKNGVQSQCKKCYAETRRDKWSNANSKEKNALINRRSKLKRKYGISLDDYDLLLKKQNGCCAICKTNKPNGKSGQFGPVFHVDHCHVNGNIRGLLCHSCNVALGCFKDNIETILMAVKYLEGNKS